MIVKHPKTNFWQNINLAICNQFTKITLIIPDLRYVKSFKGEKFHSFMKTMKVLTCINYWIENCLCGTGIANVKVFTHYVFRLCNPEIFLPRNFSRIQYNYIDIYALHSYWWKGFQDNHVIHCRCPVKGLPNCLPLIGSHTHT